MKHQMLSFTLMSSLALLIIGACHAKEEQPLSSQNSPAILSPESKYAIETNAIVPFKRHHLAGKSEKKQTLSVNDILYRKSQKARRKQNRRNKHKHHNKNGHNRRSRHHHKVEAERIFYKSGVSSDAELPTCSPNAVCNKVDTYGRPWLEKQCQCGKGFNPCSESTHHRDGFTFMHGSRQYKTCEPVKQYKKCRYFRDVTYSLFNHPDNRTEQIQHCRCPKNSSPYLVKRQAFQTEDGVGVQYNFACSPQTKIRCKRKEPCRLFSVKDSSKDDEKQSPEVNISTLCECPRKRSCPAHHSDVGSIPGAAFSHSPAEESEDSYRTYTGYCA